MTQPSRRGRWGTELYPTPDCMGTPAALLTSDASGTRNLLSQDMQPVEDKKKLFEIKAHDIRVMSKWGCATPASGPWVDNVRVTSDQGQEGWPACCAHASCAALCGRSSALNAGVKES